MYVYNSCSRFHNEINVTSTQYHEYAMSTWQLNLFNRTVVSNGLPFFLVSHLLNPTLLFLRYRVFRVNRHARPPSQTCQHSSSEHYKYSRERKSCTKVSKWSIRTRMIVSIMKASWETCRSLTMTDARDNRSSNWYARLQHQQQLQRQPPVRLQLHHRRQQQNI